MRTQKLTALGIIALALVAIAVFVSGNMAALGQGFDFGQRFYLSSNGAAVEAGPEQATTTVHYLAVATASSTITGISERGTDITVDMTGVASTTGTVYSCYMQYGHDGVEWFDEDFETATSNIARDHSSTTPRHTWQPSVTSRWTKHLVFEDVEAERFKFTCGVTGANGSLWAEAVPVEPTPN